MSAQPVAPTQVTFDPSTLGSNPWDSMASGDQAAQSSMTQQAQMNQASLNGQLTSMGGTPSSSGSGGYPAMANAYGIGSSTSGAGAGSDSSGSSPINISMPDTSTRGTNPWSYQGESNARGGGPPPTTPQSTQG